MMATYSQRQPSLTLQFHNCRNFIGKNIEAMQLQTYQNTEQLHKNANRPLTLHASVFLMHSIIGRTDSRIGVFPKNFEKREVLKRVGRPIRKKLCTSTLSSPLKTVSFADIAYSLLDPPNKQWVKQNHSPNVTICEISNQLSSDQLPLTVTHCLTISSDLYWTLSVHGMKIDTYLCPLLSKISKKPSSKRTAAVLT